MSFRPRVPLSTVSEAQSSKDASQPRTLPPGVIPSSQSADLITSWGLRAIDIALGGGLPLSSLTIVIEDKPSAYHIPLVSYITAQGLANNHAVAVASFSIPPVSIIHSIPAKVDTPSSGLTPHPGQTTSVNQSVPVADVKIAWRYRTSNSRPTLVQPTSPLLSFTSDFDLSQSPKIPSNAALSCLPLNLSQTPYRTLLENISQHLQKASERRLLSRIIVHGVTSVIHDHSTQDLNPNEHDISVEHFLSQLRTLTRVYGAVAVVSVAPDIPFHLARATADALIQIDSFEGRGAATAGLGAEWLGVLIVKKSYRYGLLPALRGRGDVWVFKRGRRKYTLERATAAPDDDQIAENPTLGSDSALATHKTPNSSLICGSSSKSSYEF